MRAALLAAALLGLAGEPQEGPPPEPPPAQRAAPPVASLDGNLEAEVRRAASKLELLRGFRLPVVPVALRAGEPERRSLAEARAFGAVSRSRVEARGRAWADVGLGAGEAPRDLAERLATDLDGAAYDPAHDRLLVDPSRLPPEDFTPEDSADAGTSMLLATGVRPDEPLLVHLLSHAIQRAKRGADPLSETTDGLLASRAWAEGEASLIATIYLFQGLGIGEQVLRHRLDPGELVGGTLLPSWLDSLPVPQGLLVDFVYRDGFAEAKRRYLAGGFTNLERAAAERRTTRDVIHPDRPPLPSGSSPEPDLPAGFALADRDSLGEKGVEVLVSTLTGKDDLGMQTGDGWVGDDLCRIEPPGRPSDGFTLWKTRWSSPEEARDFEYGWLRALSARFPESTALQTAAGRYLLVAGERVWRSRRDAAAVTIRVAPKALDPHLEAADPKAATQATGTRKPKR